MELLNTKNYTTKFTRGLRNPDQREEKHFTVYLFYTATDLSTGVSMPIQKDWMLKTTYEGVAATFFQLIEKYVFCRVLIHSYEDGRIIMSYGNDIIKR